MLTDLISIAVPGIMDLKVRQDGIQLIPDGPGVVLWNNVFEYHKIIALLAHDYLDGKFFSHLTLQTKIHLTWSTGKQEIYVVNEVSKWSNTLLCNGRWKGNFVSTDTGEELSETQIFDRYYTGGENYERLNLQTCLDGTNGVVMIVALRQP